MRYLPRGTLHRFGSVTDLKSLCRARWPSAEVDTVNEDGDFVLRVRGLGVSFDSLIVHFEGERCYAVRLPDVLACVAGCE